MCTVGICFDLFICGNGKNERVESEVEFKGGIIIRRRNWKRGKENGGGFCGL